ncbi:MAG: 2-oxo acid dehydrogenase subunit E2 [Gammaproteobacteria bacterium]|nr:2-oxo acid dehydrogenase subunit E2 [Gammaproteobacteria bacterium]
MSEFTFKLPDLGEGTVESEIGEWFIKVGDQVNEEDVVGTMMTDKAAVELSSPVSGTVIKLAGEPGDVIAVGAPLVVFETDNAAAVEAAEPETEADPGTAPADAATPAPQPAEVAPDVAEAAEPDERQRVITSPAIRRRAKEAGVDLGLVAGSGPGGRILRKDFDLYLKARATGTAYAASTAPSRKVEEIKIIGVRRMIAERMSAAKREIPHFAYVEEIDITELESLRRHLNEKGDGSNRLTLLPFLGVALIRALKEFPQCNVTHDKDRNLLLRHDAVHLGVATQTPDGLKVPVIRHAETLSLEQLAAQIRQASIAARDNTARKNDLKGSTITITSLGKLGGIASTPVINSPEVAIIGVNRAVERPVVLNGQIAVRLMMNLSSSFDHRFVDGYDAAAMIQRIREMLEHPATLFLP